MEKIKLIILFEYVSRVRRVSFWVTTVTVPILSLVPMALSIVFTLFGSGERHITILDQSGVPGLYESIRKNVEGSTIGAKYALSQVVVPDGQDMDKFRLRFNTEIEKDSTKAYIVLRPGIIDGVPPEYYSGGVSDFTLPNLAESIRRTVIDHKLVMAGLDPERYLKMSGMKLITISSRGETKGADINFIVSILIFIFTYMGIIGYGSQVMWGVIEEKSTRIMEMMVSSSTPFEMMLGKLIGIGLVGLTQYLIWVIASAPILFISQRGLAAVGLTLNSIPISAAICFILYFALGYFLFAAMYLVGGALATDSESSNIITQFMSIITWVPFITIMAVVQNPNGAIAMALSFFPFFTPGIMILRIATTSTPMWQIILSMLLMVATTGVVIWVAARIYRVGILIYGKKPRLGEIIRWLRYA